MRPTQVLAGMALVVALAGCHAPRPHPAAVVEAPRPEPGRGIGIYKVGAPYQVNGTWYYPTADLSYDENGIASSYPADFREDYTANGEVFSQDELSGAHPTLPLPSIVRVTNLDNGRSIQIRVNDRGPYVPGRTIELSRRAAHLLGFDQTGAAKVRVSLLVPETLQAQSLAKLNGSAGVPEPAEGPPHPAPRGAIVAEALPPPGAAHSAAAPPAKLPAAERPLPVPALVAQGKPAPPGPALPETVNVVQVRPTQIFIQAGAFAKSGYAERLKERLAAVGPVKVIPVHVSGMYVYRVRLGPFGTVEEADAVLAKALGAGATEARIVID